MTIKNWMINLKGEYIMSNEKCGCKIEEIKKPVKTEEKEECGCNTEETVKKPEPKKNEDCGCGCGK